MRKQILSKKNPRIYKSPLNSKGKEQFVPVVVKNYDYLVGFIEGYLNSSLINDGNLIYKDWTLLLSSERFNDVTVKDKKLSKMTKREIVDYVKDIMLSDIEKQSHDECTEDILTDYYFSVSCQCGNFHGFNNHSEIPRQTMKCDVCGRVLIHYTKKDDAYFVYDGKELDIDPMIAQAKEELGINDPEDESGEEEE